jgi:hypothetical protein
MLFGDDANPVGVGEERVVERGEELRRGGSVGVWQRSAGHVEQLTTALVAEGDERGRSRSKTSPKPPGPTTSARRRRWPDRMPQGTAR